MLFIGFEGVDGIGLQPAVTCGHSGKGLRGSRALSASWITKINYKEPPPGVEGYVNTKRFGAFTLPTRPHSSSSHTHICHAPFVPYRDAQGTVWYKHSLKHNGSFDVRGQQVKVSLQRLYLTGKRSCPMCHILTHKVYFTLVKFRLKHL